MCGKKVNEYTFKRKQQVVQMSTKPSVKVEGDHIQIDPQLLFQRLITIGQGEVPVDEPETLFSYELCTHAPALFDSSGQLREAKKSVIADALWEYVKLDIPNLPDDVHHVLDGGWLLHHLPWTKGKRYEELCQMYVDFIIAKYGSATIVFDGYGEDPSTKDAAHLRRTGGVCSTTINFTRNMILNSKKEQFLSNPHNKQRFIDLLSDKLNENGCTVHHAEGDADVLIVAKTMESARQKGTILIGEDTDLLILLLHYMNEKMHDVFFKPEQKKNVKHVKVWDRQYLGDSCFARL